MFCHVGETPEPVIDVVVLVTKPSVPISSTAAPHALGDVVVEMNIDLLLDALSRYSIKDLTVLVHCVESWGI